MTATSADAGQAVINSDVATNGLGALRVAAIMLIQDAGDG